MYKLTKGMHLHRPTRCTKAIRHIHKAKKEHQHRYSCGGSMRYAGHRAAKASSTNVQEEGVDEADLVKTDGRYLYAAQTNTASGIRIYDTQYNGKPLKQISAIGFGRGHYVTGIYLLAKQKKLVVIGVSPSRQRRKSIFGYESNVAIVDISNPAKPKMIEQVFINSSISSTRRINNMLYLVLHKSIRLPATTKRMETSKPLSKGVIEKKRQHIIATIKKWRIEDQLPIYQFHGKAKKHALINKGNLYYNPASLGIYTSAIMAINITTPKMSIKGMGWLGSSHGINYFSKKALYITLNP